MVVCGILVELVTGTVVIFLELQGVEVTMIMVELLLVL